MDAQLIKASYQYKEIIQNLMQFYMYDFSEFVELDVEADGVFAEYKNLEDYSKDKNRFPYIIQKEKKHIGFVLVRFIETDQRNYFSIAEFFIMKKYRRKGIGKSVAYQIFTLHKGAWEIFQKANNKPAQLFWKKIIDEYADGNFTEGFENGKCLQNFISLLK